MVSWIAFVIHLVRGYPLYPEVSPHAVCKVRWQLFGVTTRPTASALVRRSGFRH